MLFLGLLLVNFMRMMILKEMAQSYNFFLQGDSLSLAFISGQSEAVLVRY